MSVVSYVFLCQLKFNQISLVKFCMFILQTSLHNKTAEAEDLQSKYTSANRDLEAHTEEMNALETSMNHLTRETGTLKTTLEMKESLLDSLTTKLNTKNEELNVVQQVRSLTDQIKMLLRLVTEKKTVKSCDKLGSFCGRVPYASSGKHFKVLHMITSSCSVKAVQS